MPTVNTNSVTLHYESAGSPRAPAIVFGHSVGSSLDIWDGPFAALSERFHCIRYDIRGHGRSSSFDEPVEIDDLAADLAGLFDGLGIASAHVVGLSLGGMISQAFAVHHPERVLSLSLLATSAHIPPAEFWRTRADTVRSDGMAAVVDAVMTRWFTEPYREREPAVVDGFRQSFNDADVQGYARCCEAIGRMDLRERIGTIRAPTLIMVGDEDLATPPAMSEDLRQRIPGSEMTVVSGAAHILSVEKAETVTAYLSAFIGRHAPDAPTGALARGFSVRREMLGSAHVDRSLDAAGPFAMPWQDFITRYAWGEIWGDETLPRKTRSLLTLAMMTALHREEEFKLHLRPAMKNGVSMDELRAALLQAAIYAGVPAANAAFRWVRDVLGEELA